jgi:hypothetical protein
MCPAPRTFKPAGPSFTTVAALAAECSSNELRPYGSSTAARDLDRRDRRLHGIRLGRRVRLVLLAGVDEQLQPVVRGRHDVEAARRELDVESLRARNAQPWPCTVVGVENRGQS